MKKSPVILFAAIACVCMAFLGCASPAGNTPAKSDNANLSALSLSDGTLSPTFSADVTSYTASVGHPVASTSVTATAAHSKATVGISPNSNPTLIEGDNPITVTVTAENGTTTKNYTLTVTRAAASANADLASLSLQGAELNPTFSAAVTAYTAAVASTVESIAVTASAADSAATVTVNPLSPVTLVVGDNPITVTVTAENGTPKSYTVTVTRAAPPAGNYYNDTFDTAGSSENLVTAAYVPLTNNPALPMYLNVNGTAQWAGGIVTLGAINRFSIGANAVTPTTATTTPGGCFNFTTPTTLRIRFGAAGAGLTTGYFQVFVNNNTTAAANSRMGSASRIYLTRAYLIGAGSSIDIPVPTSAGANSFLCFLTDADVTSVQIDEISLIK